MKVSIIIPNYNGEHFLQKCLTSLLKQNYKDYKVIIVDNASSDESKNIFDETNINGKWIQLDKNYGFSYAVNRGIEESAAEYVVLLNNDVEVEEEWLTSILNHIEKDKNIFSVSSKMLQMKSPDLIDDAGDFYTILGWAYKRGDGWNKNKCSSKDQVFSSCAGAAIYRKSILEQIGLFDETFFAYMEDVDIGYRAKIYGYKNVYCPDAVVYHIGSATSGSKYNNFKVRLAARNNIYVFYKNMPLVQMIFNLPLFTLGCLVKYVFFIKKGYGKEYREGLKEGIITLSKAKKIQFKLKYFINYIIIQIELIINTFKYIIDKY